MVFEASNVAMSAGPFGTVFGIQFTALSQSLLLGFKFHVTLAAHAVWMLNIAKANPVAKTSITLPDRPLFELRRISSFFIFFISLGTDSEFR
jgi:hypothetical protein